MRLCVLKFSMQLRCIFIVVIFLINICVEIGVWLASFSILDIYLICIVTIIEEIRSNPLINLSLALVPLQVAQPLFRRPSKSPMEHVSIFQKKEEKKKK